jgi:ribosomal protection tetracycline resistance protein
LRTLNLGILAHVDAGKTTLTERLLYAAGVIDEIGSVDAGTTQTDSLELERKRGITIKAAVVSFAIGDVTVNLIDTPGHPDFIAEVERSLDLLDGAVLVISAVEGVQAQTRVLMRTLRRLQIPTLVFVNKIDRVGADDGRVRRAVTEKLTPTAVAMGRGDDLGTRNARFVAYGWDDPGFRSRLAGVLVEHDEALLAALVDDEKAVTDRRLRRALSAQSRTGVVHPVFCGSAATGAGLGALRDGIVDLLPVRRGGEEAPLSASVFKVSRGPAGERIAYVRLYAGTLRTRDRISVGTGAERKVTAISVFDRGRDSACTEVSAGRVAKVWGLEGVRIGDSIGESHGATGHHFPPPTLEAVVVPRHQRDKGALRVALDQLAEQDPLIDVRQDDGRQEFYVSLYGEVLKEVVQDTLAAEYGLEVEFKETTPICVERPLGRGAAAEIMGTPSNPVLATVGLRVDPQPVGAGVSFGLEVEYGSLPLSFHKAVEDTVFESLHQGIEGWDVTDCRVTMTHSGYAPRQSHAHQRFDRSMSSTGADFRNLTPLVLMDALRRAGTVVCEPVDRFRLEVPADLTATVLPLLARLRAVPGPPEGVGSTAVLEGDIPAATVRELQLRLAGLTRGEGVLECGFSRYEPVRGIPPRRSRTDNNPLNRKEYLLRVLRRV